MRLPWNRMRRELEGEIAHHLHHLTAEYERQGYSPQEARQMARRAFGGSEQVKELCGDEWRWSWAAGISQDLVFGARMMRRTPVITLAVVMSLALGIGAHTAIISLMDVVLWRSLPVPHAEQLELVHWQGKGFPEELADSASGGMWEEDGAHVADFFSYPSYEELRRGMAGQASVAAFAIPDTVSVSFAGKPLVAQERAVSGNFMATLEVRPWLGRLLSDADDNSTATGVVVVSQRFWRSALNSDREVIGKTISLNHRPWVVVGVLEPSFYGLVPGDGTDIYAPIRVSEEQLGAGGKSVLTDERSWGFAMIARRANGVDREHLLPLMNALFRASWGKRPKDLATAPRIRLDDGEQGLGFLRSEFRNPLFVLGGLVALLLMIACSNIANLLLARGVARQREIAARVALGCSRARLMRQFVTESALLALLGGVASIGVGVATANLLGRFLVDHDGLPIEVALDWRVLAAVAAITIFSLVLFGLLPALQAASLANATWGRTGAIALGQASGRKWSAGRMLVVTQVAMSVLLVLTAVIFTRNLLALRSADPGFDRRNLIVFEIRPGTSGYEKKRLAAFYFNMEQQLAATRGVAAVGLAAMRPMNVGGWWDTVRLAGQKEMKQASINGVSAGYLPMFAPRLVAGRNITRADIDSGAKVAVVSEDLASKLGKEGLIGQSLEFPDGPPGQKPKQYEVVGIAPALAVTSMKERPYAVWLPMEKDLDTVAVVLRAAQPPERVLPAVRETMRKIDSTLPMVEVSTMEEQIAKGLQRERMFATLCQGVGTLALVLAVIGLYGVMSYSTYRRRSEIGIRLALGAVRKDVIAMVLGEGLALAALGILAAIPVVWIGARYVEKLLSNMKPLEPVSLMMALGILGAAALAAVGVPALRAATLEPAEALRQE